MKKWWKKFSREVLAPKVGPFLAALFIRFLGMTLRLKLEDRAGLLAAEKSGEGRRKSYLFTFWHNRLLLMPYFYTRFFAGRKLTMMISMSRDGEIIADTAGRFGIDAARGSSSRSGVKAFIGLVRKLKTGACDVGITPDGPRGPRYGLHPGVFQLAQASKVAVVPVTCNYDRKWVLSKSWDGFQIPKPFSGCELIIGEPMEIAGLGPEEVDEAVRAVLLERLGRD